MYLVGGVEAQVRAEHFQRIRHFRGIRISDRGLLHLVGFLGNYGDGGGLGSNHHSASSVGAATNDAVHIRGLVQLRYGLGRRLRGRILQEYNNHITSVIITE